MSLKNKLLTNLGLLVGYVSNFKESSKNYFKNFKADDSYQTIANQTTDNMALKSENLEYMANDPAYVKVVASNNNSVIKSDAVQESLFDDNSFRMLGDDYRL